jgi:hypothetical protein
MVRRSNKVGGVEDAAGRQLGVGVSLVAIRCPEARRGEERASLHDKKST